MSATTFAAEEEAVAQLLRQMKVIATREVEKLSHHALESFLSFEPAFPSSSESIEVESMSLARRRTVSLESADAFLPKNASNLISSLSLSKVSSRPTCSCHDEFIEHHDWSTCDPVESDPSLLVQTTGSVRTKSKRKLEVFVGQTTEGGVVNATLRRKFSWKQYPEKEYFEYSSRNYTAEQRKYNNKLTRGLLHLAYKKGYKFEDFTFSMVRDRIRCYYKSYSQSAKKKRKR
eukprot:scaffold2381_cov128-Cylindrotheca_fusiformis.AAC.13